MILKRFCKTWYVKQENYPIQVPVNRSCTQGITNPCSVYFAAKKSFYNIESRKKETNAQKAFSAPALDSVDDDDESESPDMTDANTSVTGLGKMFPISQFFKSLW